MTQGSTIDLDKSVKDKISLLFQELEENSILCLRAKGAAIHLFPEKMLETYQSIEYSIASSNKEEASDASWGLFNYLDCISNNNTLKYPDNILSPVTQSIKWRKLPVLLSSLTVFSKIMNEMPQFIKSVNIDEILYGLNCLRDETLLSNDSSNIEKTDRLEVRVATANLAFYLFCFYEQNQQKIPEIIVHWQKICNSDEEFFEVKNQWERK